MELLSPQLNHRNRSIKNRIQSKDQVLREFFLKHLNARYLFIDAARSSNLQNELPENRGNRDKLFYKTIMAHRQLTECCQFVGGLSSTDGAIVLDTGLNILGFATEIIQSECVPMSINKDILRVTGHLVEPSYLNQAEILDQEPYGMRHRSAIRLSLALQNTAIFVISQDGNVNLLWDRNRKHYFWEDINTKNIPFDLSRTLFPQSASIFSQALIDEINGFPVNITDIDDN